MSFQPSSHYRYAFKQGMTGVDVWALQINLAALGYNLALDGDFGPTTDKFVRAFQTDRKLVVDGIVGMSTQREMILVLGGPSSAHYRLPSGLLKGMSSNESGFAIAAYSAHPSDPGFDLGPYQYGFPPMQQSQANFQNAYDAKWTSNTTARNTRATKDKYRKAPKVSTDRYAWQLAVLSHNWPLAADNLATIGSIFHDPKLDNEPQAWIASASGGTLSTPRQWVDHYVQAVCVFVTDWPA